MGTSQPISLFAVPQKPQQKPLSFLVSVVVHILVVGLIAYGFIFAPRLNMRAAADRYTMREVDITMPDPVRHQNSANSGMYPGQNSTAHTQAAHDLPAAPTSSPLQVPKLHLAEHTIIQPDIPPNQLISKAKLPSLLLWSAQRPKLQLIAPPQPQKLAINNTRPVLTRPTPETHISDVPVTSTQFESRLPMPSPSSASPVVVSGATLGDLLPESSSKSSLQASSAAMLSISDEEMAKGTIALPAVNQTAAGNENGAMKPGKTGNSTQAGKGEQNSPGADKGVQLSQGAAGNTPGPSGSRNGTAPGNGGNAGNAGGTGGSGGGGGQGTEPSFTRMTLPQNGQYGVVVVGSTLTDEFPETSRLWGGRLVYSVYLHVGLSRSWILQYSLPSKAEAASAGNVNHIEAPWPTYIVRPSNKPANINADALMVHGFVNETGHFESMALVFPAEYSQTKMLLQALEQWKFRPAKHNGQIAKVEVLLIIPEDAD
ncbi:MAG TPA: hypothetical protein VHZ28_02790 [Terracidiphilus sp.]|jgi:hypothetical protein|nr:hypothetical protein [Terracidiphilus sp.]HEX4283992.1 hypothetical protein [Terracidiphilus sp.]